jgi:hypothetical protein
MRQFSRHGRKNGAQLFSPGSLSRQRLCKFTSDFCAFFLVFLRFSTRIHFFAQIFSEIYIDATKRTVYLAHQIEPEAKKLNGSVQKSRVLTDIAMLKRTGKFETFRSSAE